MDILSICNKALAKEHKKDTLAISYCDPSQRCAVVGCSGNPKSRVCPHDGRRHGHGCVHYWGDYPKHSLTFYEEGWFWLCDPHFEIVQTERREWESSK